MINPNQWGVKGTRRGGSDKVEKTGQIGKQQEGGWTCLILGRSPRLVSAMEYK